MSTSSREKSTSRAEVLTCRSVSGNSVEKACTRGISQRVESDEKVEIVSLRRTAGD